MLTVLGPGDAWAGYVTPGERVSDARLWCVERMDLRRSRAPVWRGLFDEVGGMTPLDNGLLAQPELRTQTALRTRRQRMRHARVRTARTLAMRSSLIPNCGLRGDITWRFEEKLEAPARDGRNDNV